MRNKRLNIRISQGTLNSLKSLATSSKKSQSDIVEEALELYAEKRKSLAEKIADDLLSAIGNGIIELQTVDEIEGLDDEASELLIALNYIEQILIRCSVILYNQKNTVPTPPEMQDEGLGKTVFRYALSSFPDISEIKKR